MKIGFIGLGIMGSRMAANLQKEGYDLVVHNRTKAKAEDLIAQGADWADTPAQVASQVDILITMLADPSAVRTTALGENGFLDHLQAGALWMDCSTVNPSFSQEMIEATQARQIRFVDAPVAGTKDPAAKGELLFLVGGDEADVETCRPLIEVMGRQLIHIGPSGKGSSMKMLVNLMLAQAMVAFSEAMALGQSLGLPREMLLNALADTPVTAPFIKGKKPKIEANDYETEFPLSLMYKDLHLAAVTAYEQNVALPQTNVTKEVYALAVRNGLSDLDFSAIYRLLNETTE